MQDLNTRLEKIVHSRKLSELARCTGIRYQTIYNVIHRGNSALASTVEKLMPAVEEIEREQKKGVLKLCPPLSSR